MNLMNGDGGGKMYAITTIDFDDIYVTLAFKILPTLISNQTETHFYNVENWDFIMNRPSDSHQSSIIALLLEIGHTLGLHHSPTIHFNNISLFYSSEEHYRFISGRSLFGQYLQCTTM